jgi:hypothetical protein
VQQLVFEIVRNFFFELFFLSNVLIGFLDSTTDINIDTTSMNGLSSIVAPIINNKV